MGFVISFIRISDGLDISYEGKGGGKDNSWVSGLWWMVKVLRGMSKLRFVTWAWDPHQVGQG